MNAQAPMFRLALDGAVLVATLDMPGRTMNVFSWELMNQFDALLDRLERDPAVGALVLTSGKASFLAGADLDMVRGFCESGPTASRAALFQQCGRLGRLFNRLADAPKPTVAAINGLAMGGGLEVAMACHRRLVADDPRLRLGLPEIKLGLMAAAGGTQRLPRLIGIEKGIELLLGGGGLAPGEAKTLGLVDDVAPAGDLLARAVTMARGMIGQSALPRLPTNLAPGPFDLAAPDAVARILRHFGYAPEMTDRYPAYAAAVRAVIEGAGLTRDAGGDNEMDRFVDLMQDPVAGNMVSVLFLDRQRADKQTASFDGLKGARFAVAAEGPEATSLRALLAAVRAPVIDPAAAGPGDVVIAGAGMAPADLILITRAEQRLDGIAGIAFASSRAYGTALELVLPTQACAPDKGLALARALRATPYVHAGRRALLAALAETGGGAAAMPAMTRAALALDAAGDIGDRSMADVAAAVSGLFPAFAGGPFRRSVAMDA